MAVTSNDLWGVRTRYVQCARRPVEKHHRLTRARGGELLDPYTDYHLMDLCPEHHRMADGYEARMAGLVIDGSCVSCSVCGVPEYTGPNEYLTENFGKEAHERRHREQAEQVHDRADVGGHLS